MISLIIPCYNAEKTIIRSLQSVLDQTFRDIQLIIVNDGSTDRSEDLIFQIREELESRLTEVIYIKQSNQGVGAACNRGFKEANGEYLMLLDSDDALEKTCVEKCVRFLEKNRDYSVVRVNGWYVREDDLESPFSLLEHRMADSDHIDVFDELFRGTTHIYPGSYCIRMSHLDRIYPDHEILPSRYGQNLQFLWMSTYKTKTGFIDEPLMFYTIRNDSLSHFSDGNRLEKEIRAMEGYKSIRLELINRYLDDDDRAKYLDECESLYLKVDFNLCCKYRDKKLAKFYYQKLKEIHADDQVVKTAYYCLMNPVYRIGNKVSGRLKQLVRR